MGISTAPSSGRSTKGPAQISPGRVGWAPPRRTFGWRWESSPASRLDNVTSPLLLIQGDADESVAFQETLAVARSLRRPATPSSLALHDSSNDSSAAGGGSLGTSSAGSWCRGECHGQCAFVNQLEAANRTAEWLLRWL